MFSNKKDILIKKLKIRNKELFIKTKDLESELKLQQLENRHKEELILQLQNKIEEIKQNSITKNIEQKQQIISHSEPQVEEKEEELIQSVERMKKMNIFAKKKHPVQKISETDQQMMSLLTKGKMSYKEMEEFLGTKRDVIRNRISRLGTKIDIEQEELSDGTKVFWIKKETINRMPLKLIQ